MSRLARGQRGRIGHLDAAIRQHRVERGRELSRPIVKQVPEPGKTLAEIHHEVAACGVVQGPSGCPITLSMGVWRSPTSCANKT